MDEANDYEAMSDSRLLEEARGGMDAFGALYRRYYGPVFRYCIHRLFDRPAAEDVTSIVFLKVVENVHRFNGTVANFRSWLYRISTNAVNTYLRQHVRERRLLRKAAGEAATGRAHSGRFTDDRSARIAALRQALFALKPKDQTIVTLRFFERLKITDIAGIVGSSPSAVQKRLSRALGKLRRMLDAGDRSGGREAVRDV